MFSLHSLTSLTTATHTFICTNWVFLCKNGLCALKKTWWNFTRNCRKFHQVPCSYATYSSLVTFNRISWWTSSHHIRGENYLEALVKFPTHVNHLPDENHQEALVKLPSYVNYIPGGNHRKLWWSSLVMLTTFLVNCTSYSWLNV